MASGEIFPEANIREQLNRILTSPGFRNSSVLSGFLEFVTDETLKKNVQSIKEYTIGVHVLSRNSDFNPQLDSIVRINAGRLRRALNEYYNTLGRKDEIRIDIPKGSYVPVFQPQYVIEQVEINNKVKPTRNRPAVAVLPFRNISRDASRDYFADGLGEQLTTELSRFQNLAVVSYYSARHVGGKTTDIKEAALLLGAKYILTGSIQHDAKHLHIGVQLVLGDNGEHVWANSFERSNSASGLFEIQHEIVRNILTAIGGYYGAITRDVMKIPLGNQANSMEIYDAVFWYYHYQKVFSREVYEKAILSLQAAVKEDPQYALAWAMLGELYLDDKAMEFQQIENPTEEGLQCARRAVSIDPNCQHGYMALAWIHLFHHNRQASLKAADQAMALNPNSADVIGAMGFVYVCAGEFEKGFELLDDSLQHNPFCPWWYIIGFVFYFLHKREYENALLWVERINRPDLFWDPMMKACALGHLNRPVEAAKQLELLMQVLPDAGSQVKAITESFLLSLDLNKEILEGLEKAGLDVVDQTPGVHIEN